MVGLFLLFVGRAADNDTLMALGIGVFVYGLQHYLRERGPLSQLK